jgi:MYXO-CTERM domain-containing protein
MRRAPAGDNVEGSMKRTIPFLATLAMGAAIVGAAQAGPADINIEATLPSASLKQSVVAEAGRAGGVIASVDEQRQLPAFMWAVGSHPASTSTILPAQAALAHMRQFAAAYDLSTSALRTATPAHVHDLGRGAVVVTLRQEVAGVEVFHSDARVVMKQSLELVAISGALHPAALSGMVPKFSVSPEDALLFALEDLTGDVVGNTALSALGDSGRYTRFGLAQTATGLTFSDPARVKFVLFPVGRKLVPSFFVELYVGHATSVDSQYYRYIVSAADGSLLYRENLTASDSYDYRVWADTTAPFTPFDGPQEDYTPHPTGNPSSQQPTFVAPNLISMEGFNTNPNNAVDPWLPPSATETTGNNVDAYQDDNSPDGFSNGDVRATATSANVFDRVYDTSLQPQADNEQIQAAVTELFYVTNWLHDWFYDSGFDEAAGNAQDDNFGRGGEEGDSMKAEAQDGGGFNNANMSTPADGARPRMQMYMWGGKTTRTLDIQPVALTPSNAGAAFGPQSYDVTAPLLLVEDGNNVGTDACQAPTNNVTGAIVLVDRGQCSFALKAANVEAAGGLGVVVANNQNTNIFNMGQSNPPTQVGIPAMMISLANGDTSKTALGNGAQTAHMLLQSDVNLDGTIDNSIVAHEFGHYFHNRLADGGNNQFRAMGEGWGDFLGLYMGLRSGDDINGTYAVGIYALGRDDDPGYFGIRRFPYSIDQGKNALSFRHIQDGEVLPNLPWDPTGASNSEVHAAGEIWTSMLWDGYLGLVAQSQTSMAPYDFAGAQRRMADYIVAGLQGTREAPTYTEARDAVIAAVLASDAVDARIIAQAFAQRGAGSCAESPPRFSTDFVGVVESGELKPDVTIVSVEIDDSVGSCDQDGFIDGGEIGQVVVKIANTGMEPLSEAELTLATTTPGAFFINGDTASIPTLQPFDETTVSMDVWLDADVAVDIGTLDVDVSVEAAAACDTTTTDQLSVRVHFDDVAAVSATETFESALEVWTKTGNLGPEVWRRVANSAVDHVYNGTDWGSPSDTAFESPDLLVHATDPLIISFDHIYDFEAEPGTWWDGGVIEISNDAGANWADVSNFDDPSYDGVITNQAGNVLAGRMAYSGQNAAYPMADTVSLDLGTNFAGDTVRLRFRIGTDQAAGAEGWFIDNVAFTGITNTPFADVTVETEACQQGPLVNAGPDQTVTSGSTVTLDASATRDLENDPLTWKWSQLVGDSVALGDDAVAITTFTAPVVDVPTTLRFQISVDDGMVSGVDDVDITVVPEEMGTGGGPTGSGGQGGGAHADPGVPLVVHGGCGCEIAGTPASSSRWSLALLGLLLALRRRRSRG